MQRLQKGYRYKERVTGTKNRIRLVKVTCWTLISVGAASLIVSVIFVSQILALIGLGLVFWGAILLFIQPEEYTKKVLLDAAMPPSLETLSQMINELGYRGKAIYFPPKYLKDPEANKAYIPKHEEAKLPTPKQILKQEHKLFLKNPEGILFTPPGAQLTKLFEKRLGKSFAQANLQYVKQNLPRLFIDNLEIAENLEIEIKSSKSSTEKIGTNYGTIHVKITNSIFKDAYKENKELSQIFNTIGSPISSAIACALTKVTGRPLIIRDTQSYENGKIIEVTYQIGKLEYKELPEAPVIEVIGSFVRRPLSQKLFSLIPIILSFLTLGWMGQLTLYEMMVWGKGLGLILFTSRVGEPISLGIGMKVIYYYMIGFALLFSGIITYLTSGKKIREGLFRPPLLPKLVSFPLIVLGFLILLWINEITLYEMFVWGKSLSFILFTSRVGEPISLGIGMRVIYYYVIGLALLFSGILTYFKRKGGM